MSTTHPPESSVSGLSAAQVAERVSAGRTNEYRERTSRSAAQILRANVFTIFNGILGAALVLVLALGHWADALFGFVLVLNTATGTLAEIRAKRALDRLSVLETPRAIVVRDGAETEVAVGQVVLDDVVRLAAGQQVPADGEVLTSDGLEIDESILTGESRPVRPVSGAKVMSGTTVTAGTGLFRTTAVGGDAYAHRLAREARKYSLVVSELQAGTNRVLHWISWVIVPVALVLVWSQLRLSGSVAEAWSSGAWRHAVVAGIAGVVSMVPQGLVLLTSVNFATASLTLARRNVLVQELPAVEVLARVDTLCLDKTGTITTGRIRLGEIHGPDGGELVVLDARTLPAGAGSGQETEEDLERLADAVERASVLGRVTPEQKRALVRALKSRGHVVAMTGDGVNDALALKDADLGIAMGNGAPATKAVARLVLLKGEFSALPGVVAQGRRVMANTERIASLFLAKTIYASLIAVVVSAMAVAYPFLPRQFTVVSSLTIGIPAFVLALAPSNQRYREGFLGRVLSLCVPAGLMAGTVTLSTYLWLTLTHAPRAQVTTATTLVLITCGLWLLTLTARPLTSWRLGLVALMGTIAVLGVVAPPVRAFFLLAWPTPGVWWVIALMAGLAVGGIELVHLVRRRIVRGRG